MNDYSKLVKVFYNLDEYRAWVLDNNNADPNAWRDMYLLSVFIEQEFIPKLAYRKGLVGISFKVEQAYLHVTSYEPAIVQLIGSIHAITKMVKSYPRVITEMRSNNYLAPDYSISSSRSLRAFNTETLKSNRFGY